ncbi:MAG TPA: class I SAM-dependent methyltransferase [Streptosporangiaceae bacterium]|nr:class I SAM-dependent methyltransferase [Streptosporangiaceae bacterium]
MTARPCTRLDRLSERWWTLVAPGYDPAVALVGWHRWQDALVSDVTSGLVLDVGCGPAHLARGLLARGAGYVGVDRNAAMVSKASRRVAAWSGRGVIVRADVTALPFRGKSFDIVVATGVLGLLDLLSRRIALREMVRVSRKEIRLLEPVRRAGEPSRTTRSRLIAFVRDRPVDLAELVEAGLEPEVRGHSLLAGVYSMVRATRR